jgi:hypothetical protein
MENFHGNPYRKKIKVSDIFKNLHGDSLIPTHPTTRWPPLVHLEECKWEKR